MWTSICAHSVGLSGCLVSNWMFSVDIPSSFYTGLGKQLIVYHTSFIRSHSLPQRDCTWLHAAGVRLCHGFVDFDHSCHVTLLIH